jgi:hypothetical protein
MSDIIFAAADIYAGCNNFSAWRSDMPNFYSIGHSYITFRNRTM